ncbi:MAG: hypothetical protein KGS10_14490 [Chloroflexi bacterium]|nr:hypothetical protein [Chloroflexota bacterium]
MSVRASIDRELHYPDVDVRHVGTVVFESVNDARAYARATIGKRTPATVGAPFTVHAVTVDDVDVLTISRPRVRTIGTLAVDVTTDRLDLEEAPDIDAKATAGRYAATLVADIADALPEWRVIPQSEGRGTAATIRTDPDGTLTAAAYAIVETITDRLAHSGAYLVAR